MNLPTPEQVRAHLDEYVIGQDDAKKVLSVAVYNHYKKVIINDTESDIKLAKSNILMLGPTGSGKTLITSTLARSLDVPFAAGDSTAFISSGVGREVDNILGKLIENAGYDVARAERGIIYLDEIDKIARKNCPTGEGIQQQLLKVVEGTPVPIVVKGERKQIDTTNILFIVGGAFVGLETMVMTRMFGGYRLVQPSELIKNVLPEDLSKFGIIPEFCGRIPVMVGLNALDRNALIDALTKPKNALVSQYQKMFALDGVELVFERSALEKIADKAIALKTGARALRTIMEDSMRDIMYSAPGDKTLNKVTITAETIMKCGKPVLDHAEAKEEVELVDIPPKPARSSTAKVF